MGRAARESRRRPARHTSRRRDHRAGVGARSSRMNPGYLVEDGYQHAFPVRALLRARRAPIFTTGSQLAARFRGSTDVTVGPLPALADAMAARKIDVVFTTSQNFDPDELRRRVPELRVVHVGHGESDKTQDRKSVV